MIRPVLRAIRAARAAARDVAECYCELQIARTEIFLLRAKLVSAELEAAGLRSPVPDPELAKLWVELDAADVELSAADTELAELRDEVKRLHTLAEDSRGVFRCVIFGRLNQQNPGTIRACTALIERIDAIIPASEGR